MNKMDSLVINNIYLYINVESDCIHAKNMYKKCKNYVIIQFEIFIFGERNQIVRFII